MIAVPKPAPGAQSKLLDSLPKVERRGFDVEAKLFMQVQKEYEEARTKKKTFVELGDRAKHTAANPLLARSLPRHEAPAPASSSAADGRGGGLLIGAADTNKLEMKMKTMSVLPSIPTATHPQEGCSSQQQGPGGAGEEPVIRSVAEVHAMLPAEYSELKQMMELHRDLKGQMARNKEQMARLQESTESSGEMMDLLRQQSSHVVMMMKDILDRMESYPEELWALYGAVEAFEQCSENRERLLLNRDSGDSGPEESNLGPTTVQEHEEALDDIYSHILEAVENFLNLAAGNGNMGG